MPDPHLFSQPRGARLFCNNKSQAAGIPAEFEMPGHRATVHREGDRLIIEPVRRKNLTELLAALEPLREEDQFPDVDETSCVPSSMKLASILLPALTIAATADPTIPSVLRTAKLSCRNTKPRLHLCCCRPLANRKALSQRSLTAGGLTEPGFQCQVRLMMALVWQTAFFLALARGLHAGLFS